MNTAAVILVASACCLAAARPLHAQPADVSRVLRTFDFEEWRQGNAEDLPMYWSKVGGPTFPHYVNARLATGPARSGKYSFRFELNGGGLLYRYDAGRIKVQPGAHYRVEGFCRTTVLAHARARLTAYLADLDGRPRDASVRHSDLYAAKSPDEPWKRLAVELSADEPGAAYLVIELALLQPQHFAADTLGERTLHPQDIRGTAWFDDVTVSQVPQVTLSTDRPGNVFRRGDPLHLYVRVNDRFTDDLSGQVVVRDAEGRTVYQRSGAPDIAAAGPAPGEKRLVLPLPDLKPGWYEASLLMTSGGRSLGGQSIALVRLADDAAPARPDPRFGLIATDLPFAGWGELPEVLPLTATGRVKLALWTEAGDVGQVDAASFDRLLQRLAASGITPTACLLGLPPAVAEKVGGTSWEALLKADPETWRPQLAYLLARHANHIDRWQLGPDGTDAFVTRPETRQVYDLFYREFAALKSNPDLAMPWPAWYELDGELPATVALSVPPSVLPGQLPLYMADVLGREGHNLSLSLELLDRARYGREAQIRDLAQRVVYALSAGADRIDLPLPFTVERRGDALDKQPQELWMVVRTLATTLGGAAYQGRVPVGEGVEAFLFDRGGEGIIALWDRGAAGPAEREFTLNLGDRAAGVDLWGNVTPLMRLPGAKAAGRVRLRVGPTPTFLVGVDGRMAQLRASVAFDRPLLESSFRPHARKLRFTNPYKAAVAGAVRLRPPPGWTLNPPTFNFALSPGETFERELSVVFPYNSFAGAKVVTAEFKLQGEADATFTVPITLTLGLSDVGMQSLALRDGPDVIVQQMVTNYGDRPINYNAFAVYPGQARQERLVTALAPGKTTMKRYRFSPGKSAAEVKIRVGLKEQEGTRILNEEVPVQ